jgi:hypothetical protein
MALQRPRDHGCEGDATKRDGNGVSGVKPSQAGHDALDDSECRAVTRRPRRTTLAPEEVKRMPAKKTATKATSKSTAKATKATKATKKK